MDTASTQDQDLDILISVFLGRRISVTALVVALLTEKRFKKHILTNDLLVNAKSIVEHILQHPGLPEDARDMTCALVEPIYAREIRTLADNTDWHFSALRASPEDLEDFGFDKMAKDYEEKAPRVWALLDALLKARKRQSSLLLHTVPDINESAELPGTFQVDRDEARLEGITRQRSASDSSQDSQNSSKHNSDALLKIKKTVLVSVMMRSTNRKSNTLASTIGIFLHSACTPQKVIDVFARMGLSIAQTTIHSAINSLSANTYYTLRALGQTRCVALAYDNFDVDLKVSVPVVEKAGDTLKHLTSGLAFLLQHGVREEDLRFSDYLWDKSELNPKNLGLVMNQKTYYDLLQLFREPEDVHQAFNAWIFLCDVIENIEGLEYLQSEIGQPDVIEQIPVVKTDIYPAYAMDVNNSTVSGNIHAIENLMQQVGYGTPDDEDATDISNHVVLIHGDLGTGERIRSILSRRSSEDRPWERFQYVLFCPGLFHVKMAAIDMLWRFMIKPVAAQLDETSFMKDVGIIRPRETYTISSKCEFRRMHQVVQHVSTARRLDCWRIGVQKKYPQYHSLEEFATSKPGIDELKAMADELVQEFVANGRLSSERSRPNIERDEQFENGKLVQQYLLFYEELTYAMNIGDIGRLERTLLPWIPLFKAAGKHKYATAMQKFLLETHFECPPPLRHAIRYNILVNPSGQAGKFRGIDWVVEAMNYDIKVAHGGQGPNRTVKRMITESALTGTFKEVGESVENNLLLYTTSAHAAPDMRQTFFKLRSSFLDGSPHRFVPGRKSVYCLPDMLIKGEELVELFHSKNEQGSDGDDIDEGGRKDDCAELRPSLDDIVIELL